MPHYSLYYPGLFFVFIVFPAFETRNCDPLERLRPKDWDQIARAHHSTAAYEPHGVADCYRVVRTEYIKVTWPLESIDYSVLRGRSIIVIGRSVVKQ